MRRWFPILLMLLGIGNSFSFGQNGSPKTSDRIPPHVQSTDKEIQAFAATCGLKIKRVQSRKAFSSGSGWEVATDLAKPATDVQSDFSNTAEVWRIGNSFVVRLSFSELDVGTEDTDMYCFDSVGKLQVLDQTMIVFPQTEQPPWGLHRSWQRKLDGSFLITPAQFIDEGGKVIERPRLDEDGRSIADSWRQSDSRSMTIEGLKLPKEMFQ
jgi:hypothetical protein